MSDLAKLQQWFTEYLIPAGRPTSTGGYMEDVTWELHKDEDKPKGSFVKGSTDLCTSEYFCSQLGINQVQLNSWEKSFDYIAMVKYTHRFRNQMSVRKSKPFQHHILNLIQLECHLGTVQKYDDEYGHTVPLTNLSFYLV